MFLPMAWLVRWSLKDEDKGKVIGILSLRKCDDAQDPMVLLKKLTCTSPATKPEFSLVVDSDVITVSSDIGIATTDAIINTTVSSEAGVAAVVGVRRVVGLEERGDGACLIAWDGVDVGETTARGVGNAVGLADRVNNGAFRFENGSSRVNFGGADIGKVGAAGRKRQVSCRVIQSRGRMPTHLLGHAGLKMFCCGPRHPFGLSSPGGPATPSSPEA